MVSANLKIQSFPVVGRRSFSTQMALCPSLKPVKESIREEKNSLSFSSAVPADIAVVAANDLRLCEKVAGEFDDDRNRAKFSVAGV